MGRPRKRKIDDAAHSQTLDSWGPLFINEEWADPPGFDSLADSSISNAPCTTISGDSSLPISVTDLPDASISSTTPYDHTHGNEGIDSNFDFLQVYGSDPTLDFSQFTPQAGFPFSLRETEAARLQAVNSPPGNTDDLVLGAQSVECKCLPQLYAFLGTFQKPMIPIYPFSLVALKKTAGFCTEAVRCQHCSTEYSSALQNSMLLGTLMNLVIIEYRKLLEHIDEQAAEGAAKSMRMGNNTPEMMHLHTGTLDCPMGINLDLSGDEWKVLAKRTVRKEIFGPGEPNLAQIIQEMKDRQQQWHSRYQHSLPQHTAVNRAEHKEETKDNACACLQGLLIDRLGESLHVLDL